MEGQMSFFGGVPFQSHSDTSRAAAALIEPRTGSLRHQVFAYLRHHGPATDEKIQEELGMPASTERPRRVELVRDGLVADTGQRALTHSGRRAVLWAVTSRGRRVAA